MRELCFFAGVFHHERGLSCACFHRQGDVAVIDRHIDFRGVRVLGDCIGDGTVGFFAAVYHRMFGCQGLSSAFFASCFIFGSSE